MNGIYKHGDTRIRLCDGTGLLQALLCADRKRSYGVKGKNAIPYLPCVFGHLQF